MSRPGRALPEGQPRLVPSDFCLPDHRGRSVCLRDLLGQSYVLVWFYRGHW